MIIKMDNMSAPSWERAQRLYEKNIELDNRRRKSAQAKVPSDPNIWQQMRENYEAIILEDHTFSEKHNIEHALWQLHYKKIEELRSHYSNAQASGGSNASLSGKGPSRPDRTTKIRLQFKTFLSEATGFYHDLILKIRSKYGLPLGYFSEDSDNRLFSEKDGKKSADLKKGLISCHRCLIYLGDLARYKGLYGEPDSKAREYAAASSYYLQAASLWPSIGNPHHQLAILASYSGDDLVTVYRYFRSLAVDNPCSTARDNLIVAFEKNRQSYCQLHGDVKVSTVRFAGKGRGQEAKLAAKDTVAESATMKGSQLNPRDASKSVCVRFVRLNGILFSRTSMETFGEVLSLFMTGFRDLLSSGLEEEMSFGADAFENGLFFVRLVSILIFTTHNVKRETEGQTYAEIVQRAVLLQHAFTATFEIMGHVVERCEQLRDPYSSYLLPGILVYVEWLACHPDLTSGGDVDEKQATARSNFWNYFVSLMNKLLSIGSLSIDDHDDESCFDNMSKYEEGETGNRLALWEDFELRGFLPIVPAQTILDFSRKHSFGSESHKEKIARVKRVLAAGKVLVAVAKINEKTVSYDSKAKKFVIGVESAMSGNGILPPNSILPSTGDMLIDYGAQATVKFEGLPSNSQLYAEGEDEDEEIVFKPTMMEKQTDSTSTLAPFERVEPQKNALGSSLPLSVSFASAPLGYSPHVSTSDAFVWNPVSAGNFAPQDLQPIKSHSSNWLTEETLLSNSLKDLRLRENGHLVRPEIKENISNFFHAAHMVPNPQSAINNSSLFLDHSNALEAVVPLSRFDALLFSGAADASVGKPSSALPVGKKNPVARPVRHLGPPPGFGGIPKQVNGPISGLDLTGQNPVLDDYSWLDGYKMTSSTNGFGSNPVNYNSQQITSSAASLGAVSFPFPGKQFPTAHQVEMQKGWPDYDTVEHLKLQNGKQLQQHQQVINGNPQLAPLPEQFQGSVWTGRHFV